LLYTFENEYKYYAYHHLLFHICSSLKSTPKIRVKQEAPKQTQNSPVKWMVGAANLYSK